MNKARGIQWTFDKPAADLLSRVRTGDSQAWEEIVHRYDGLVRAVAYSFRLQPDDIRDVVQMTWLKLAENAHRVRLPERLGSWRVIHKP
jgi:DNA-directed RNA polymerase specialized sigma24 family protein